MRTDAREDTGKPPATKPRLTIVSGLQGSGKSTVAQLLAVARNAEVLRTDVIRKEMFAAPEYGDGQRQQVYEEMFRRAGERLSRGGEVVLDATFEKRRNRDQAAAAARAAGAEFEIFEVTCSEAETRKRLAARTGDPSDATWDVYLKGRAAFEPLTEPRVTIDTSGTRAEVEAEVARLA